MTNKELELYKGNQFIRESLDPKKLPKNQRPEVYHIESQAIPRNAIAAYKKVAESCFYLDREDWEFVEWKRLCSYEVLYETKRILVSLIKEHDDDLTVELGGRVVRKVSGHTANIYFQHIKAMCNYAGILDLVTAQELMKIKQLKPIEYEKEETGRSITPEEHLRLLQVCATDEVESRGIMLLAMIQLARWGACRNIGIARAMVKDYHGGKMVIRSKRKSVREIILPEQAQRAIEEWLEYRGGDEPWMFFKMCNTTGYMVDSEGNREPTCANSVGYNIGQVAEKAGVDATPHSIGRRSYISGALEDGQDYSEIMHQTGHVTTSMIAKYDRRHVKAREEYMNGKTEEFEHMTGIDASSESLRDALANGIDPDFSEKYTYQADTRVCTECGESMAGKRADATVCSPKCRKRKQRREAKTA